MAKPGMAPTFKELTAKTRSDLIRRDPRVNSKTCFSLDEFRAWLRARQVKHDLWKCHYCGLFLVITGVRPDHFNPLALGGMTELGNLVPACARCNTAKGKIGGDEFIALLELVRAWPGPMREDLMARLAAGPQWRGGGRRGRSRAQEILEGARERGLFDLDRGDYRMHSFGGIDDPGGA